MKIILKNIKKGIEKRRGEEFRVRCKERSREKGKIIILY